MRPGPSCKHLLTSWIVLAPGLVAPVAHAQNPSQPPPASGSAQSTSASDSGKPSSSAAAATSAQDGRGAVSATPPAGSSTKAKPSDAQLAAAKAFYQRGAELYAQGRYGAAWTEFSAAYQIVDLPDLVLNLALTEDKMNRPADAAKHYREFLQSSPNDPDAEKLRKRIEELEHLATAVGPQPTTPNTTRGRFPVYSTIAGSGTLLFTIIGAAAVGSATAQFNVFAHTCAPNCSMTDVLALRPTLQAGDAFLSLAAIGAAGTVGLLVWELRRGRSPGKTAILAAPPSLNPHGAWAR